MRLFYITILLAFSISFAGFASQKQSPGDLKNNAKSSCISSKKQVKFNSGFNQENESLQKDFINNNVLKISHTSFILLAFLFFLFLKTKAINAKIIIKRLKFNYWYLFKMLYPKHFFW